MANPDSTNPEKALQKALFDRIRELIPANNSLQAEISEILNVGQDGAYRRISGDTQLKMFELRALALHFQFSVDEFFGANHPNHVTFQSSSLAQKQPGMIAYLSNLKELLKGLRRDKASGIIMASKDIPYFQLFQFPELVHFKIYFWRKTMYGEDGLRGEQFKLDTISHERDAINKLCQEISYEYAHLDSQELWTNDIVAALAKQIRYYFDVGDFEDPGDALELVRKAEDMINFLQKMAETGQKLLVNNAQFKGGSYELYRQDLIINDNVISMVVNDQIRTYLVYNSIQYLVTAHHTYGESVRRWMENLPRRSEQISTVSERSRLIYFNGIRNQLRELRIDIEKKLS